MPVLRIKLPNHGEVTHVLSGERISIGRRPDNTIQILDRSVSGHHAELIAVNGHYRLHDLKSTNLCFVDGQPVTDYHLHSTCKVAFGTVECEFDEAASEASNEPKLTVAQLERDIAFLRGENSELIGKLDILQRRIDILSSARLVTGKTDHAPGAAAADSFKAIVRERDDLRHQNTGLKLELDQLREELLLTIRERDSVRQQAELLQMERIGLHRELEETAEKKGTQRIDLGAAELTPAAPPVDDASITQRLIVVAPHGLEKLPPLLRRLRAALDRLVSVPTDHDARGEASNLANQVVGQVTPFGDHALVRIAHGVDDLLRDLHAHPEPPRPPTLRTLLQAVDFFGSLLEPRQMEQGKSLSPAHILAIDDDAELLATVVASLQLAQIQTDGCGSAEDALHLVATRKFDLILADVSLPGMDGTAFCAKARDLPGYRKTPVVFLTVTDTLEQRAESSLNGGTDFIGKPFNVFELALKVQTWVVKYQLGLV